ncbi:hypothetical protein DFH06DRAFT_1052007 [Mycena polygramma]|nr:hypothetical protein DFH06DRAFT_1052007 [Mycena polygramma]
MSAHRSLSTKYTLPNNPAFIDFPRSDGDSTLWPSNTTRVVDSEGCVNFMQPVGLDEPISIKWRMGAGDAISVAHKLPGPQPYVLRGFPNGYRMFDHHKGKAGNPRHDVYLFGSNSKARFRSVPEFIPHALWLMSDGSEDCKCKYCSKKPQREITSSMGNLLRNSSSPSPSRSARIKAEKPEKKKDVVLKPRLADRLKDTKLYAAVQKSTLPKASPHIQPKHTMLVERNNNIREACRPASGATLPRWLREGELVWCSLDTPIAPLDTPIVTPSPASSDETIRFWPGIIDEVKLHIDHKPIPSENLTPDQISTPWVVQQSTTYKVQLLAISKTYLFADHMVTPYQSYVVPNPILSAMVQRPVDDWDLSPTRLAEFDPMPPPPASSPTFADTLTPFAVALQIASTLSSFWCLTDDWDAKLTLPPAAPRAPPSSLQSAIEFAGAHNASISSGPRGQFQPPTARVVTQTRFQGFWWGGERIWADDLVRLKPPRGCLAPMGAQHIFSPSGPGTKSKLSAQSQGRDPALYGAISRGVFLKIDTIFIVDGVSGRECRVTGMLYELADDDWEDPNLPRNVESIPTGATSATSTRVPNPGSSGDAFALPPAPNGFKFRPILAPGYEVIMCLSLISGRYYPRILTHPLMKIYINEVIPLDPESMMDLGHLWSLEGLFGGYKNSVDPTSYKASREKMIVDGSREAMLALQGHIKDRRTAAEAEAQAAAEMELD